MFSVAEPEAKDLLDDIVCGHQESRWCLDAQRTDKANSNARHYKKCTVLLRTFRAPVMRTLGHMTCAALYQRSYAQLAFDALYNYRCNSVELPIRYSQFPLQRLICAATTLSYYRNIVQLRATQLLVTTCQEPCSQSDIVEYLYSYCMLESMEAMSLISLQRTSLQRELTVL